MRLYSRGECLQVLLLLLLLLLLFYLFLLFLLLLLQGAAGVAREVCRVVVFWSTYKLLLTSRLPPALLLAALALTILAKGLQRQVVLTCFRLPLHVLHLLLLHLLLH